MNPGTVARIVLVTLGVVDGSPARRRLLPAPEVARSPNRP